jgi:hypothetical protein
MIAESFDRRTFANMEVALERACKILPTGAELHEYRRYIASQIVACAEAGHTNLGDLTEAGRVAVSELRASLRRSRPKTG